MCRLCYGCGIGRNFRCGCRDRAAFDGLLRFRIDRRRQRVGLTGLCCQRHSRFR